MHNVLTLWFQYIIARECKGQCFLIVYADDFIAGFEYPQEAERFYQKLKERAERFYQKLKERMEKFGLELEEIVKEG